MTSVITVRSLRFVDFSSGISSGNWSGAGGGAGGVDKGGFGGML